MMHSGATCFSVICFAAEENIMKMMGVVGNDVKQKQW